MSADLVFIATQAAGVVWTRDPDSGEFARVLRSPVAGLAGVLSEYTIVSTSIVVGDPVEVFDDPNGTTPLSVPFEADEFGAFPGFCAPGSYCIEVDGGDPIMIEICSGSGDATSLGGVPFQAPTSAEDGFTWVYDDATGAAILVELPSGGSSPPEAWIDITSILRPGWTVAGSSAKYRKDRNIVYMQGYIQYFADVGSSPLSLIQFPALPVNYRPAQQVAGNMWTLEGSTSAATRREMWPWFVSTAGLLTAGGNSNFSASPNFNAPPEGTVFNLGDIYFPIDF